MSILPSSTHAGLAEQANTLITYLVLSSRRLNRYWRAHGPGNANSSQYHRLRPDKHGAACLSVVHGLSILCSGNTCMHATLQGERYPSSLTSLPYCVCVLLEGYNCYRVGRGKLFLLPSPLTYNCTFRCCLTNTSPWTSHRSCQLISEAWVFFPFCSTKSAMKNLQWRFQKYFSDMLIQV